MKEKTSVALLAFFLGNIGVHRFYLGQTSLGILYTCYSVGLLFHKLLRSYISSYF